MSMFWLHSVHKWTIFPYHTYHMTQLNSLFVSLDFPVVSAMHRILPNTKLVGAADGSIK